MAALKFASSHNMVVKTINGEVQIQALVDKKKVIITKTSVKSDLQLEDAEVFLDKQVEGMSKHKEIYVTPSHTKKVFANMKRQGKDFSGRDTPLFPTMIVQAQEQVGEGSEIPTDSHHTPTTTQPSTSKPQKKQSRRKQRKDTEDPQLSGPTEPVTDDTENVASVPTHSNDPLLSGEDRLKLNELMELCTSLSQRVLDLEKTKTSQAAEITELKERVKKLEKKGGSRTHRLRRLYKVGRSARVVSSEDEGLGDQEDASKQGRKIDEIDQDAEVTLVDETQGRYGDNLMFDTGVLDNEQDMAEKEVDMAEKDVSIDNAKITRKRTKPDKHGHEKEKSAKEPEVKEYRPSYEKEHTQANNDLATATFSWLNEYVAEASAFVEALLSKKPPTLEKHVPSRTQMHVPSSQLATPSSIPSSKPMSPPADIMKPSPSPNE
ncbi:hypothetical protein Tco_1255009 [Tanacetum coccineum]